MKKGLLVFIFLFLSLYVLGQSCTLSVSLSSSSPSICSGGAVVLTAKASAGSAPYTYVWNTGETTSTISVNKAGTYTVSVTDNSSCPPVTKSISVATAPSPDVPTADGASVCLNTSATLTATAPGGTYQWYDSNNNFLFTGNPFVTPAIKGNTTFYVTTTINGCTSQPVPVVVTLFARPTVTGASVCAGNTAILTASGGDTYEWFTNASGGTPISTSASFTTPPLLISKTYYVVSTVNGCSSARTPVTATVTPPPQAPIVANTSVCAGSSANLHADAPAGIFDWFDVPTGGTSLISSPDYTTPPLTVTTTYYVQTSLNGCVSPRTTVTVKVNQIPLAPQVPGTSICPGTSANLAVTSPTANYQWYDSLSGGTLLSTGPTFSTPVLTNSTTYYVQTVNGGCISDSRTPVRVTVNPVPPAPSASGVIICPGSFTTLTAIFPGGNYQWFDAATGGNQVSNADSYTTPPLTVTTTYYVQTTISGCTSARTPVTVTVLPSLTAPTAANTSVCSGNSAVLTGSGSSGDYEWYDAPTGGNLLLISQIYVTPPLTATTTYYLQTSSNTCTSSRTPVTVTVNPIPSAPSVTSGSVCRGGAITLTASAASGSLEWYDAPTGGNLVTTGNSYTIPSLTTTTTYYVQNVVGSCVGSRTPVTASTLSGPDPAFEYATGTFCISDANPKPVIKDRAGGTFTASPAGLVFVNNTTGLINIAASSQGIYIIRFTSNGPCATVTSSQLAIFDHPGTTLTYKGPFCQDGGNPLPEFSTGSSAGLFSASPTGLVFKNPTTGEIDVSATKPGTYTITNRTNGTGVCAGSVSTATVTINARATVNAGPDQTVAAGTIVQLAGTFGVAPAAQWSGGAGTFADPSNPNTTYTPAGGETSVILTLKTTNPPGACGAVSDNMTITITPAPATPIAPGASICAGSSTNLSALGPGGTYKWYDAPANGNLLATGPVYTTPTLITNTTYYVQTTNKGVTSARTPVLVTVTNLPPPPIAPGQAVCSGSSVTLTASGSTGSYQWYDAVIGGNLISVTDTYDTPALTAPTSYYVQTVINGCISTRTKVDITINPVPAVTSLPTGNICSGSPQNYTITANMPAATFSWSRGAITGISNPGVINQTTNTINETLINTGTGNINVTYIIIPVLNGCSGVPFNYVVTVYPNPAVTSAAKDTICNSTATNYDIAFNVPGTSARWSRAAVPGISNFPVLNQAAPVIHEVLFNTTDAPIDVTYTFTYGNSICAGQTFNFVVRVNPPVMITSPLTGTTCGGAAQDYVITSNVPSATFSWSRDAVANISNPPVSGQTSNTIDETLINTSTKSVKVPYLITPTANGCTDSAFTYTVTVAPQPAKPKANSNSPVCLSSTIDLSTPVIANATYTWTGPNGFSSSTQNPKVTNVTAKNSGKYILYITVNGCNSDTSSVDVAVDQFPRANAGPDQRQCSTISSIQLAGSIGGGTTTGVWSTNGSGTFLPSTNQLNAIYIPSQADKNAKSVVLNLTSTSKDDCSPNVSHMSIRFEPAPASDAGPDQSVCNQSPSVILDGNILIPGGGTWTTAGSGRFSDPTQTNATYFPSAADIANGSVKLTLRALGASPCDIATDDMVINFLPPPTINAGGTRYVLKENIITLTPTSSDPNVTYQWTPNIDISDDMAKNPVVTGTEDRTYTLTVTDSKGCVSHDETLIKVSPIIMAPNTFTPNGDNINDQWNIVGLIAYPNATIDIFDRYGQKVFHSLSYPKAWDGTYNGKQLPTGTYYYVIDTKLNGLVLSGYIALIR